MLMKDMVVSAMLMIRLIATAAVFVMNTMRTMMMMMMAMVRCPWKCSPLSGPTLCSTRHQRCAAQRRLCSREEISKARVKDVTLQSGIGL